MKKLISVLTFLAVLTVSLSGCLGEKGDISSTVNTGDGDISETESVLSDVTSVSSEASSKLESVSSQQPVVSTEKPELVTLTVGPYEVYDAYNSRGLNNTKSGFSYGVAKNGQPHSTSVNNQKRFDGMSDVKALALDTVSTDKRMYLTFDCGYEYKNLTADILDTLKEKNVKAAFFVTLPYAKQNPALVRRMIDEGHIVGNHSNTHPVFPDISREKMAKEIWELEDYLKTNFNYVSKYFRFPTGANSHNSLELVSSMGYTSVFWSVAHADWDTASQPTKEAAVETVTSRFHPGAVILLHAVSKANTDGLAEMIDIAHDQGYTFKTLDEYVK